MGAEHGLAVFDARDEQIASLQAEVRRLRSDLAAAKADADEAHQNASRAVSALRKQLSPLYRALQLVFGEIDAFGVEDVSAPPPNAGNPRATAVWESWKSRLPGGPAKIIDALLLHSDMNAAQLAIATGIHRNSISQMIYKLNRAGLINKNSGRYSLKSL